VLGEERTVPLVKGQGATPGLEGVKGHSLTV
jgi:hypothetical protein